MYIYVYTYIYIQCDQVFGHPVQSDPENMKNSKWPIELQYGILNDHHRFLFKRLI